MKTNIVLPAIIAILVLTLLFAFRQSGPSHRYLTMNVYATRDKIIIIDENGASTQKEIKNFANPFKFDEGVKELSMEINEISAKGYRLAFISPINGDLSAQIQYVFEKE